MSNRSRWMDRRSAYRVQPLNGMAQCGTANQSGLYSLLDLSRSGVALEGGTSMPSGERVSVKLVIPGYDPLFLGGKVVRSTQGARRASRVAIDFSKLDPDNEDRIGNVVLGELVRSAATRCMVVSGSERERKILGTRLASLGVQVVQARTPVEAIHRLETSARSVDSIIIGRKLGDCDGVEFASFIASAYPKVRCVLSGKNTGRRAELARHVAHGGLNGRRGTDDLGTADSSSRSKTHDKR